MFASCYRFFKVVFYILLRVYNRLEVQHADRVPETGGVIVVANHASYFDPPVVGVSIKRRAVFMAKESLFRLPLFIGRFVSSFSIPVRRGRPQPSTIKESVERLKRGELIIMFPQGGRKNSLEEGLEIKRGVDLIARLSRAAVVPALIEGTEKALPIGAFIPRPAKIKVRFGNPIMAKDTEDLAERIAMSFKELKEEASREIR